MARGRKSRSLGAVLLALISVSTQMIAIAAVSGSSPLLGAGQLKATMAAGLVRGIGCGGATGAKQAGCVITGTQSLAGASAVAHVEVPSGSSQCPDSGPGASCGASQPVPEAGTSALPDGLAACPADPSKPALNVPGACLPEAALPVAAPAAGIDPSATAGSGAPSIDPRLAASSTRIPGAEQSTAVAPVLQLKADQTMLAYGSTTILEATSSIAVDGTPWAVEIFDRTKATLVGACMQASTCKVAYTGKTGLHSFVAYVVAPTATLPANGIQVTSNPVDVRWLGVGLVVQDPAIVAPGKAITFTAFASEEVGKLGYLIELRDSATGARLTYCGQGTTCSTSLVEPTGGVHAVMATLIARSPGSHAGAPTLKPYSGSVYGTWLDVQLDATATAPNQGGTVWFTATANTDLSKTPWSIYIFNDAGQQIGQSCNSNTCNASLTLAAGDKQSFKAVIARSSVTAESGRGALAEIMRKVPVSQARLDVQVSSPLVKPTRILWGVDSCKAFTQDPLGNTGLYPQVYSWFGGPPDFWGRYLTTTYNCPGLSPTEISGAHTHHTGILPIYDDYDCSALQGYATGTGYAAAAAAQAQVDGIPAGTGIAVDIEPPGAACPGAANVDPAFLAGWYDGIKQTGYVPIYYGDTTAGSAFASAWCADVATHPEYAWTAYLWSFEPSLLGRYTKPTAPGFAPNSVGCGGYQFAWQYELSAGGVPDVDQDEALSKLPLWYP
jgi:hypothetical protein